MPVLFANPAGLWALLGIPLILLIHFLQRESRRIPVSTLFLLEHLDRESVKGRRFDRLRHSLPLWLQLLGVLLLCWLLSEPRWTAGQSVQRVVLVLDNSASMEAFREALRENFDRELPKLTRFVGTTEFTVLESSISGENLYRGTSLLELQKALELWKPGAGSHSPEQAIRVGRGIAGSEGTLVLVTDHPGDPLPFGALRLSVGTPIDNVGFSGLRVDAEEGKKVWRATLRNYAKTPQSRSWFLASGGRRTEARTVELAAGASHTLQGEFPEGSDRISLLLTPDRFTRDDRVDLVNPSPKALLVSRTGPPRIEPVVTGLIESLENTSLASDGESPDFWFASYNPLAPGDLPPASVVLLDQEQVARRFFSGPIVAANHSLISDLDWQGLLARSTPSIPPTPGDTTLLWQGERSLVILREGPGVRQLIFNFDVVTSNAPRLPAFILLVHRFAANLRGGKVVEESRNVELRQPLAIAHLTGPEATPLQFLGENSSFTLPLERARQLRAPSEPGFFRVEQGPVSLLHAAANFADTREADFSEAGAISELGPLPKAIRERQTVTDPLRPLWILLLAALALVTWHCLGRGAKTEAAAAT
ncbi:MAG: BatA domain-containing protein [Verrucomicrobiales bacterium]|nr:BatA domain-containing protein [Verrucomicrobiales bacterium]